VRGRITPQRLALRSRIVLLAADGLSTREIGRAAGTSARTVILWRRRFLQHGLPALGRDRPGAGASARLHRQWSRLSFVMGAGTSTVSPLEAHGPSRAPMASKF
jgi:transposase